MLAYKIKLALELRKTIFWYKNNELKYVTADYNKYSKQYIILINGVVMWCDGFIYRYSKNDIVLFMKGEEIAVIDGDYI